MADIPVRYVGPQSGDRISHRWWELSDAEACRSIASVVETLYQAQKGRLSQYRDSALLYGGVPMPGYATGSAAPQGIPAKFKDRITYNLVASVIDTVTAKIGKNRPKPLFLTSGGDHQQQQHAKLLTRFVDGVFYENQAHRLGVQVFKDAAAVGTGVFKVLERNGRVAYERTLNSELFVDEVEAFYGFPRSLYQVKNVDRDQVIDVWPEHKAEIKKTSGAKVYGSSTSPSVSDLIQIRESWHLRSGPEAKDGKHLISLDNVTLLSEPYEQDEFPFAFLRWVDRLFGFWGQGAAERLQSTQFEINKILQTIQRSMHLAGTFKIFAEMGSKLVPGQFNNEIGTILFYTGTAPTYAVPPIVQPETYQHLQTLKQAGFELEGVSMLSAASKKPEGLDSGRALREYNDIESDRFMTIGQAYENLFLDLARLTISKVKEITKDGAKSYKVKSIDGRSADTIDWKEIELSEDEYVMKCYPVNSLPEDPAGRLQTVQEYAQAGFLSPKQARRLLDFPDLDQVEGLENATEEYLHFILGKMVDKGEFTAPDDFDDLARARELALEYYARGKSQNVDFDRLELLQRFIAQIDDKQKQLAAAVMPPGAMPGAPGAPQAVAAPPPTSNLIPNNPAAPAMQ